MSSLSQSELQNLWIQAGGDPNVAPLMSAIAMAESGGNPDAKNAFSGACGLWQIWPPQDNCADPMSNAQMAVGKYESQGLKAWQAFTNGAYKAFIGSAAILAPFPFGQNANQRGQTQQANDMCMTFTAVGVCWDGIVGIGAIVIGITLMVLPVILIALNSPQGKQIIQTGEQTAITAAMVAPK